MRKICSGVSLLAFCLLASQAAFGQIHKAAITRLPVQVTPGFFRALNAAPKHQTMSNMSAGARAAAQQQSPRIISVPTFSSSFTFAGQIFPYTMMGRSPHAGDTTVIPTTYVPMSFFFDEFVDTNGNNLTIDATAINNEIRHSPNFENSPFGTGDTQFGDAIQRAEFWNIVKGQHGEDAWHTLLGRPEILIPVQIEVPVGSSVVFQLPDGTVGALIDINFINSQLTTLIQTEGLDVHQMAIFVTRNAVYGDFVANQPVDCCIGGFHGPAEVNQVGNNIFLQTVAFATSLDAEIADGIFGDPTVFADVNALSHEISESLNDPFANNVTPNYQLPGAPAGACQNVLEVGDVVENLTPDDVLITLHGFTYHPQTEGLLQWFEGLKPSNAIDGAYSYPDETRLTSPFMACPTK